MRPAPAVAAFAGALVLAACSGGPGVDAEPVPTSTLDPERLEELRDQLERVAREQAEADEVLRRSLDAVRELDGLVIGLRDPGTVDSAVASWPRVQGAVSSSEPGRLRDELIELALAVDDARATLHPLRSDVTEPWERRYLEAEDELLVRLRSYAETADELARTLLAHGPTYERIHAEAARLVEQRSFYRSPVEAADAFELAVQPLLTDLATAQAAIAEARERRDAAAEQVNEAAADAEEAYAERPSPGADPSAPAG